MRKSIFCLGAVLLMVLGLTACQPETQGPMTWLDRPLDGDKFPLEPITLQAHASDADSVTRIEFYVGYNLLATVPGSGTRFSEAKAGWEPSAPGTYTIRAHAVDAGGNIGPDAVAQITIGEAIPTPTPIPAATATPVSAPTIPPPQASPAPARSEVQITFTADRYSLKQDECTTLHWSIQGGYSSELDGMAVERAGEKLVCPSQTTTYGLRVDEGERWVSKELTISVEGRVQLPTQPPTQPPPTQPPAPAVCPGAPVIASFNANPTRITAGQQSMLSWGKVDNATSASIAPGIGGVGTPGSTTVSPPTTTTYTLTATGCGGTVSRQVTIVVDPAPLPVIVTVIPVIPPADKTAPSVSNPRTGSSSIQSQSCSGTKTTTITATVTDAGGVNRVVARYSGAASGEVGMSLVGGNEYRGTIGPIPNLGNLSIVVVAWDNAGNSSQAGPVSLSVVCIQ